MTQFNKDELKSRLTEEQYRVTQEKATEAPFTGKYNETNEQGTYHCVVCGEELFKSETKYNPGCGWPSFWAPAKDQSVGEHKDMSHGMVRTEVVCNNCGAHLGHVFPDGPQDKTGLRYCINSASLDLKN